MTGDPASHISIINQILSEGHIPKELFYPITHIYVSQIFILSGIDILTLHRILPLLFSMLYVPFMYLVSKSILPNKSQIVLAMIASMTLVNGWHLNFTPNYLANQYFPLLVFIMLKAISLKDLRWNILLLIMAFFYPIFHPVPTLFFILILISISIPGKALTRHSYKSHNSNENTNNSIIVSKGFPKFKGGLLLILLVWGISWISSFYIWESTIKNITLLISESANSNIVLLTDSIIYASSYGFNVAEHILKIMGGTTTYAFFSVISFPIIWERIHNPKTNTTHELDKLFSLYSPLFVVVVVITLLYFFNFMFGPLRLATYIVLISTLFIGFFLNHVLEKIRTINQFTSLFSLGIVIFTFVCLFISGIYNLYPSPFILELNPQTTHSESDGMDWLFKKHDINFEMTGISISLYRFGDLLLTPDEKKAYQIPWAIPKNMKVPYHFGYGSNNSTMSSVYKNGIYMAIYDRDKSIYRDLYPNMAEIRWTSSDFDKVDSDYFLDKIYSNDEFEIYCHLSTNI